MNKTVTRKKCDSPKETLKKELIKLILRNSSDGKLPADVPLKWEKHGDLVLLPATAFQNPIWSDFGDELWSVVSTALKADRVARKYRVKNDDFRTPNVELLKGTNGWVIHVDNKIKYTYDVTKCMFSSGNITEKLRIAQLSCKGESVVDLYAGIGYFTLPFLIHAKASFVHACEWNPNAVEALEKNLALNNVKEKCSIHFGDNKKVCPEKVADRVNLGLIPSSEAGWETACRALKPKGGILHIHGNVTSHLESKSVEHKNASHQEWNIWAQGVSSTIKDILSSMYNAEWNVNILEINQIKSYAPHIDHLVLDVECHPSHIE